MGQTDGGWEGSDFDRLNNCLVSVAAGEGVIREATKPAGLVGIFYPAVSTATLGGSTNVSGTQIFTGFAPHALKLSATSWTHGAKLYFDATALVLTDKVTGNQLCGIAVLSAASGTLSCAAAIDGLAGLLAS